MRLWMLSVVLVLAACSSRGGDSVSSSSASSSAGVTHSSSSSASSINPKAPKVYLQWQEKKLVTLIKGSPRRKLSLIVSGAARELVYVGTFSGEQFDLQGTYVTAAGALLKASIAWKDAGNEIWVERDPAHQDKLIVRNRDIDEKRPYLTLDTVLATVTIPGDATVLPKATTR